jgi:hypothetical protein
MKKSTVQLASARGLQILAAAVLSGLWACSSDANPGALSPTAAPDSNGTVRQDVAFNFERNPSSVIEKLFDLAYATATKYSNATAACFRVRIEGDDYGKPINASPGTFVFDKQELNELRRYASVDALKQDSYAKQRQFGPVFMFIVLNTRSPYCKALQMCKDWESEKPTYSHCPGGA